MLRRISLAALLHAAHAQQCGEGHLELDWSQARLKYNNLGGHGKVSGDPSEVRYENMGTLGGRQVDVVMKSRETDAIMEDKCDYPNNNRGRGSCWAEDATLWGYYGSLSTAKGWKNELKLNVKFIYNDDGSDATPTSLYWSFLDIGNEESVKVYGTNFEYSHGSKLVVDDRQSSSGWVQWDTENVGMTQPDGTDPMDLSADQKSTIIKLLFSSVQNFDVDFGSHLHTGSKGCCQTFWFAGNSNTEPYCEVPPSPPPSPPPPSAACLTEENCESQARAQDLARGTDDGTVGRWPQPLPFADEAYQPKGCYTYGPDSDWHGAAFFGRGGSEEEMQTPLGGSNQVRVICGPSPPPSPPSLPPTPPPLPPASPPLPPCSSEKACYDRALSLNLEIGALPAYEFAGEYPTKGCYTYGPTNKLYEGKAFFGTGGTSADRMAAVTGSKVRIGCENEVSCWQEAQCVPMPLLPDGAVPSLNPNAPLPKTECIILPCGESLNDPAVRVRLNRQYRARNRDEL